MLKVKICGITTMEDATLAASLGADFVGFNFYKDSPRKVSVKNAQDMIAKLPPFVTTVGIFVDEDPAMVVKTAKKCALKYIQLHGNETPEQCKEIAQLSSLPVIKAFRISDETSLGALAQYAESVSYFLLDACKEGEPGGTGEVFNWDLAIKAKEHNKPLFLAGGLTPENVREAVKKVQPFAVDTASGVERLPRRKDYDKMKGFITQARGL